MPAAPIPPAELALQQAAARNDERGDEVHGFMSEAHGFLPAAPRQSLPEAFADWDRLAGELPRLTRELGVRAAVDRLPTLDPRLLPDADLWRAVLVLGMIAHAYARAETPEQARVPGQILEPWREVCRRLGRSRAHLSYVELVQYNWRRRAPEGPMRVENLELMVPAYDLAEEQIFYLTMVEMLDRAVPVMGSLIEAQRAVLTEDRDLLAESLARIADGIDGISHGALLKIDPNPRSATAVDPIAWAKQVAPFAVPLSPGDYGPSGTASPLFHMMDVFLARGEHASELGKEALGLRAGFPDNVRLFLDALGEVDVGGWVRRLDDTRLDHLYAAVLRGYAGPRGLLDRHRLKTYGFLEVAFKVGRNVTVGGFAGLLRDRPWEAVDRQLEAAMLERRRGLHFSPLAEAAHRPLGEPGDASQLVELTLPAGVRYRPGDRVAVHVENDPETVRRALDVLGLTGHSPVALDEAWQDALRTRGEPPARALPASVFFARGALRPVPRAAAATLYRLSSAAWLRRILDARAEEHWQLDELLHRLARGGGGIDVRRITQADPWEPESLARLVQPLAPRMYSVASPPSPESLHVLVNPLRFASRASQLTPEAAREGVATSFLTRSPRERVSFEIVRPPRFALPADPGRPIVMFAGGSGMAPFRGFLEARAGGRTIDWLFFGTRSRARLYAHEQVEAAVRAGVLEVRIVLSREDVDLVSRDGALVEVPARGRIDRAIGEARADLLRLLRTTDQGGAGASFYVCGQAGFSQTVMRALTSAMADQVGESAARELIFSAAARGRLMQDVFTTYTGPIHESARRIAISEVVRHNDRREGLWMVIRGKVFDVTDFAELHPGGDRLIRHSAGLDATHAYQAVRHHLAAEIDALLATCEIGAVARVEVGPGWGVFIDGEGLKPLGHRALFAAWVQHLYLVVELENAVDSELSFLQRPGPASVQAALEAHARFLEDHVECALGLDLERLFAMTVGLVDESLDGRALKRSLSRGRRGLVSAAAAPDPRAQGARAVASGLLEEDRALLASLKARLREGVRRFESLGPRTLDESGRELVELLLEIPLELEAFVSGLERVSAPR